MQANKIHRIITQENYYVIALTPMALTPMALRPINWDHFHEKGSTTCRSLLYVVQFFIYSRSLKCPLHIASYALRIGVSVMELFGSECLLKLIIYALGPFSQKESQLVYLLL